MNDYSHNNFFTMAKKMPIKAMKCKKCGEKMHKGKC